MLEIDPAPVTFAFGTKTPTELIARFQNMGDDVDIPAANYPALTDNVTNGRPDTLTFPLSTDSFSRPESFISSPGLTGPRHFDEFNFPNGVDWQSLSRGIGFGWAMLTSFSFSSMLRGAPRQSRRRWCWRRSAAPLSWHSG
jgi:hypothetical protein